MITWNLIIIIVEEAWYIVINDWLIQIISEFTLLQQCFRLFLIRFLYQKIFWPQISKLFIFKKNLYSLKKKEFYYIAFRSQIVYCWLHSVHFDGDVANAMHHFLGLLVHVAVFVRLKVLWYNFIFVLI